MNLTQYMLACAVTKGVSKSELAAKANLSPSSFSNKIKRNSLRPAEIEAIAEALNARIIFIDAETSKPLL